jgi:phosphoribosylanthranilate isomerase
MGRHIAARRSNADSRSMRTRIKICCIASIEEARLAIAAGADALGFLSEQMPGPRAISDARIAGIVATVPPPVATFLLTTGASADTISAQLCRTRTNTVQILRPLPQDELVRLAALEPAVRRVQAVHVEGPEALDRIPACAPHVHAFLLDSGRPDAGEFGGTGRPHDWAVSAAFVRASPLPVFLAGGLSPANVHEAVALVRPFGVDLCTGARSDGRLDPDKLAAFIEAVRGADAANG